ncbi:MAG: glutamate racemase [Hyphomicrobiales bacterium]|nr:glutamate racemase [Hyphomicrobiales bacterium]
MIARSPVILVFDSGLGGLTVFTEIAKARPDARFVYIADDAAFPYGAWPEAELVERMTALIGRLIAAHAPDCVVIACNTASTLALPALRARHALPFVGTVPAVKTAAERSASRVFSVLATPGTVARDYTRSLIGSFAADCDVTLVGSTRLAALAESQMRGESVADDAILAEIAPCFVTREARHTDVVTLSCTHYPLLLPRLQALAPWPVTWIDPATAIARRVGHLLGKAPSGRPDGEAMIGFTAGAPNKALMPMLGAFGFERLLADPLEAAK